MSNGYHGRKFVLRSIKADHQSCWLCNGGIEFKNITKLEAHVVILATGFDENKKYKTIKNNCTFSPLKMRGENLVKRFIFKMVF
jgi:hypothetical protein